MKRRIAYLLLSITLLASWQYFGSTSDSVRMLVSSPELMYEYFVGNTDAILLATWTTFLEAVLGLLIACTVSFGIMIVCFYFPGFMEFVLPIMVTSQVIPLIVLAPFFIILLGIGILSKVVMASVLCFFPIFVNFAQGYKSIDPNVREMMHIHDASTWYRIKNVYFPLSMPSIMAGLKVSATLSVIGAIVAEFAGAEVGIGKNLFLSAIRLEPDLMMVSLVFSALLGGFMYGSIHLIERYLGSWYLHQS